MTLSPSEMKLTAWRQANNNIDTERIPKKHKKGEEDKPAKRSANDIGAVVNGTGSCILTLLK